MHPRSARLPVAVCALAAGLAAVVSGCAPALPAPPPHGAAPLDARVLRYDDVDFPANRAAPLQVGSQCTSTEQVYGDGHSCTRSLDEGRGADSQTLKIVDAPFRAYWTNIPPSYQDPGYVGSPTEFHRLILDGRYYAVDMRSFGETASCTLAVDTGAPQTVLFSTSPGNRDAAAMAPYCTELAATAVRTLRALDPDGGSIAAR